MTTTQLTTEQISSHSPDQLFSHIKSLPKLSILSNTLTIASSLHSDHPLYSPTSKYASFLTLLLDWSWQTKKYILFARVLFLKINNILDTFKTYSTYTSYQSLLSLLSQQNNTNNTNNNTNNSEPLTQP